MMLKPIPAALVVLALFMIVIGLFSLKPDSADEKVEPVAVEVTTPIQEDTLPEDVQALLEPFISEVEPIVAPKKVVNDKVPHIVDCRSESDDYRGRSLRRWEVRRLSRIPLVWESVNTPQMGTLFHPDMKSRMDYFFQQLIVYEEGFYSHLADERLYPRSGYFGYRTDTTSLLLEHDATAIAALARAILEFEDHSEKIRLARVATQQDSSNDFAYSLLLEYCLRERGSCSEFEGEMIEGAIRVANSNGYVWSQIASLYIQKDERDKALKAIAQASAASLYDDYSLKRAGILMDLSAWLSLNEWVYGPDIKNLSSPVFEMTDFEISKAVSIALDVADRTGSSSFADAKSRISKFCGKYSDEQVVYAEACTELVERSGLNTDISSYVLQSDGYQRAEDALGKYIRPQSWVHEELSSKTAALLSYDPKLLEVLWESWSEKGATPGLVATINEAIRLSQDPEYKPCSE